MVLEREMNNLLMMLQKASEPLTNQKKRKGNEEVFYVG